MCAAHVSSSKTLVDGVTTYYRAGDGQNDGQIQLSKPTIQLRSKLKIMGAELSIGQTL
jgi:hypothetical protein